MPSCWTWYAGPDDRIEASTATPPPANESGFATGFAGAKRRSLLIRLGALLLLRWRGRSGLEDPCSHSGYGRTLPRRYFDSTSDALRVSPSFEFRCHWEKQKVDSMPLEKQKVELREGSTGCEPRYTINVKRRFMAEGTLQYINNFSFSSWTDGWEDPRSMTSHTRTCSRALKAHSFRSIAQSTPFNGGGMVAHSIFYLNLGSAVKLSGRCSACYICASARMFCCGCIYVYMCAF